MIKDILLVIDSSQRADAIISLVLDMAERFSADLTIEILSPSPLLIPALAPMTTMYVPEHSLSQDESQRIAMVRALVVSTKVSVRVIGLHDGMFALARRAGQAGPIADLIVMGDAQLWDTPWLRRRAAETIIMGGGSPLMILHGAIPGLIVRHAVLGWKDSAECRRCLHDLVLLLEPGTRVSVVGVGNDSDKVAAAGGIAEAVRYLNRHGLTTEAHDILNLGQTDAAALEEYAVRHGADLLAIGAFGHSRLHEVAFGGVTRSMVDQCRLSLLLSR